MTAFLCPHCQAEWQRLPLTQRQRQILDYIQEMLRDLGYAPTFEEIMARFGFESYATVHEHLTNIERKGWIHRRHNEARAITIVEAA